jgi:hypothetical protein
MIFEFILLMELDLLAENQLEVEISALLDNRRKITTVLFSNQRNNL